MFSISAMVPSNNSKPSIRDLNDITTESPEMMGLFGCQAYLKIV
jgi:hypothetical protein